MAIIYQFTKADRDSWHAIRNQNQTKQPSTKKGKSRATLRQRSSTVMCVGFSQPLETEIRLFNKSK
jgi:hypothetical protein